jgi:hypothetical protein
MNTEGHAMNVLEDDGHPPGTFTIGFYEAHPELIVIGRSRATAHKMWDLRCGLER